MNNWFETLSACLDSEKIGKYWNCFNNISYGETFSRTIEVEPRKFMHFSIYRENNGLYERPVLYYSELTKNEYKKYARIHGK